MEAPKPTNTEYFLNKFDLKYKDENINCMIFLINNIYLKIRCQSNKNDDDNVLQFLLNDIINNKNYSVGFDILNNDIDKINLDKISKSENQILELLSKEGIIKIYKQNLQNKKDYVYNTIKIEEVNYKLLYKLIKDLNDECEQLKIIKEEKLQNSGENEQSKNDSFDNYSDILLQNEKITKENITLLNEINIYKKENMEILQRYSEDLYILKNMVNSINSSTI